MKVLALICVLCSITCSTALPTPAYPMFPIGGPYSGIPVSQGLGVPFGGMPSPVVSPYSGLHSGFIPSLPAAPLPVPSLPVGPVPVGPVPVGPIPSFGVGGLFPSVHHIGGPVTGIY